MSKMHADELTITTDLVRHLINEQCPEFNSLVLKRIPSSGTVHALFRLGEEYVVRMPRIEATAGIEKEWRWLKHLAPHLTTPISAPVFRGQPEAGYPWPWLICPYLKGESPAFEPENTYHQLACELADFVNKFHAIPLIDNAPQSRRGVPLTQLNQQTRQEIARVGDEFDIKKLTRQWDSLQALPGWHKAPVWVHGDLLPGNILIESQKLSAVIDFSDVGIGDPACDLVIAWALFNQSSRNVFREKLQGIDENTWLRGKGWALSIAAIMLPYYKHTNPEFASLARRMLAEILTDMD